MKKLYILIFLGFYTSILVASKEKPLVIVVPSYKNAEWYKKNLGSIFAQQYENYRIIYIDDCSPDGTHELVQHYVREQGQEHRVTLIKNKIREGGSLPNIYRAIHMCRNDEIVLVIDGDDWLKDDPMIFTKVNAAYSNPNVMLTYGQCEQYPNGNTKYKPYPPGVVKKNVFREYDWLGSHLRTFYAGLFKETKLKDFLRNGDFYKVTGDLAFMFPVLEMAGEHSYAFNEILYVYNEATPLNDFKLRVVDQLHCDKLIRSRPKYEPIKDIKRVKSEHALDQAADCIILSEHPEYLKALLSTLQEKVLGIDRVYVICNGNSDAYKSVRAEFPSCVFIDHLSLSDAFNRCLQVASDYVLITHDEMMITQPIDIAASIRYLSQTKSFGCYHTLGKNITRTAALTRNQKQPPLISLDGSCFAWQFEHAEYDWRRPFSLACTLYHRDTFAEYVKDLSCTSVDELIMALEHASFDWRDTGLCYATARAICLPDRQTDDRMLHHLGRKLRSYTALETTLYEEIAS